MTNYFGHENISASDIKSFISKMGGGTEQPANIQEIYDMGTLSHAAIFEPYKVTRVETGYIVEGAEGILTEQDYKLAMAMKDTFFKDEFCRMIISRSDFKREHEFYNTVTVGDMRYEARCKADGSCDAIQLLLEFKGLKMLTQKAFDAAIERLHYDLAAVHYLLTAKAKIIPIVGISKLNPKLMFKRIIKKHDETYAWGEAKLIQALTEWRELAPDDIQMVA